MSLYDKICEICGKNFKNTENLKKHLKRHDGFKCEKCGKTLKTKGFLNRHFKSCGGNNIGMYKCDKCNKNFYSKYTLKEHIYKKHTESLTCFKCKKIFNSYFRLINHQNKANCAINDRTCSNCDKIISSKQMYEKHIENCGNFSCICGKTYKSKKTYNNHLNKCKQI